MISTTSTADAHSEAISSAPAPGAEAVVFDTDLGMEIPLSMVHRELNNFFASEKPVTRASLMNFAIYSESLDALAGNLGNSDLTDQIREITREHACRALLLNLHPASILGQADAPVVRCWVTAHCNLGTAGNKSVCSEQISFRLQGDSPGLLANTLFAHLDSDLPLVFWWQGGFTPRWEPTLYSRIDRLVIDSGSWADPAREFRLLEASWRQPTSKFSVMDLTWTRILQLRLALAACFDDPASLGALAGLASFRIRHHPDHAISAKMLVVWMARRLGWKLENVAPSKQECQFSSREGLVVTVYFVPHHGPHALESLELTAPNAQWTINHCPEACYWRSTANVNGTTHEYLTPASLITPAQLVVERLRRGCNNKLYFSLLTELYQLLE